MGLALNMAKMGKGGFCRLKVRKRKNYLRNLAPKSEK
jgi:hypothetical protein